MILVFIGLLLIVQVVLYRWLDRSGHRGFKVLVNALLVVGHLIVFPWMFIPEGPEGPKCGMPALAITVFFWVFGFGGMIVAFLIYKYGNKIIDWLYRIKL